MKREGKKPRDRHGEVKKGCGLSLSWNELSALPKGRDGHLVQLRNAVGTENCETQ